MINNKWQPVSTAPINKLVLVLVCERDSYNRRGKPYGSLGMFEPIMGWYVNDEYLTESCDDQVIGWMDLPQYVGEDMDWVTG